MNKNSTLSRRSALALTATLALSAALPGCSYTPHLVPLRGEVFTPGAARVVLMNIDGDIIHVDVFNQTSVPLVVYRDAFLLSTATGMRPRVPGGVSNIYTIPPGSVHDVRVRFDLSGLSRGDQVVLVFQNALVANGQPIPIESLPFALK